ncbi:PREDICTED: glycerophosphodiester phosphodiesterase protein kinase domain-containing GDPDL2-like [Populus euphratica]|uniref:Glycerophosphodiester phosphodiesterase protein kinase domain-containing GDPDL2-like n=1 Tax=Populus euphratica TaxID=75702 RepID=A0AAJ6T479_POPEU|nr:PREDICTED: glycerophosphodiester phosphodiesterase protein kinase domain-containing GDPDL2-like [Populus euphratica]
MDLSVVGLLMLVLVGHGVGLPDQLLHDPCPEACKKDGPAIRFPFRLKLKEKQSDHCGYPGFELSCTDKRETLLQLPNSVKLYVNKIDYASQLIFAADPDKCLPKQLRNFNLSTSPFKFGDMQQDDYAFFNCTSRKGDTYRKLACLSGPGYDIFAYSSDYLISYTDLTSCTKIYNLSSVPWEIIRQEKIMRLNWSMPACRLCEAQGKFCRRKNENASLETECYDKPKSKEGIRKKIAAAVATVGSVLLLLVFFEAYRVYSSDKAAKENQKRIENFLADYKAFKPTRYTYADIKRITNEFKDKLGQGAYGTVFKGQLSDEIFVAVKILNNSTGNGEEFVNEVGTMGKIHHVNVIRLVGYCADGFRRALVYDYLSNESLEKFISSEHGDATALSWEKLQDIALGMAKGIEYLHQGCDQRILHFDIKPHNILLDDNFNPKISDFGLAKLCSKDQSAVSMTTARGTLGYIAPEVFSRNFGNVSYKSDVYSFGMVLLEMVGGRKTIDDKIENNNQIYFPEWVYNSLDNGEELRIRIEKEGDAQIAKKLTVVGLWCIQWHPVDRPSMNAVVQMLEGAGDTLTMPPSPFASAGQGRRNANMPGRPLHQALEVISEAE